MKNGDKRVDVRLAKFAQLCHDGTEPAAAMRLAGYKEGNVHHGATIYVEKARAAGLLVDPAVIQDAVAIIEAGLPDLAREIVRCGKGGRPKHQAQLDYIQAGFDRTHGKPTQKVHAMLTTSIIPDLIGPAADTDKPLGDGGSE